MIETDRLRLRRWQDSDREPFAQINADPRVMEFLGDPQTRDESDAAVDRQLRLMDAGEPAFWAAERKADAQFIGFIGVKRMTFDAPFTPGYEIGWRLASAFWGQGFAPEGARAALAHAFANWAMPEIYSITVPSNLRSQSVMQKIGMRRVAGGDFDHPLLPKAHSLSKHVLFRIGRSE